MSHTPRGTPKRPQPAAAPWPACFAPLDPAQVAARNAQHAHLYGHPHGHHAVVHPAAPQRGVR